MESIHAHGVERIYCLGDLVGYYCHFNEVTKLISEAQIPTVMGNHDHALVNNDGVIARSKTCTTILKWQLERLNPSNASYLRSLPSEHSFEWGGKAILMVHAGLKDPIDEYVFDVDNDYLKQLKAPNEVLVTGHTHLAAYKRFYTGRAWLNPGSVGQPRDGDPRASYLTIDEDWNVEFVRVAYDYQKLIQEMAAHGFAPYISEGLTTGKKIGA